jgi:hypothetical protein
VPPRATDDVEVNALLSDLFDAPLSAPVVFDDPTMNGRFQAVAGGALSIALMPDHRDDVVEVWLERRRIGRIEGGDADRIFMLVTCAGACWPARGVIDSATGAMTVYARVGAIDGDPVKAL